MPTNYPGDPTATEAPSVPPENDDVPTVALPADGDPPNAATFEQGFKVLADWIAWLKKPFAKAGGAGASSWAQAIQKWQNARKQDRFVVDHMGHPGGRFVQWIEDWSGVDAQIVAGTATWTKTKRPWFVTIVNSGGAAGKIEVLGPDATFNPFTRALHVVVSGNLATDQSTAVDAAETTWSAGNCKSMEIDIYPSGINLASHLVYFGETEGGALPVLAGAGFKGMAFVADAGTWKCVTGDGTNVTLVSTGVAVAAAAVNTLRIEWWGSAVADDTTTSCRFYLNGVWKATITTTLPTGGVAQKILGARKVSGSAVWDGGYFGPLKYTYSY